MVIYQALLRLWETGKFSGITKETFAYLEKLGVSHIWYTGVIRHSEGKPFVKGDWGSPYSISDYYDVNPYLADNPDKRLDEFKNLVERSHKAGFKVIIDFVPNHVSPDYSDSHSGIPTTGHCDFDWTDTLKIDYTAPGAFEAMTDIVLYWASLGVDGFRCDMVELVPLRFFEHMISRVKALYPATVFIGEAYDKTNYSALIRKAGFDYLYDKSGLYDTLRSIVSSSSSATGITRNWQELSSLQGNMLNFLENHDEQRLTYWAAEKNGAFCALAVSALFYPCPFMLYAGQEFLESAPEGSQGRKSIFNHIPPTKCEPDNEQGRKALERYREILNLKNRLESWSNYDLCYAQNDCGLWNSSEYFAFLRYEGRKSVLVVCNFTERDVSLNIRIPKEAPIAIAGASIKVEVSAWDFTSREFS